MFGVDDIAIAALIASIASAAINYNSQQQAAKRANRASLDAIRRQQEYQRQATQAAMDRAKDYRMENRQQEQEAIRQALEEDYSAPALAAQEINAKAATTQGDVSEDYRQAKANSDANVENMAKTFANMMARMSAAKQLRTNEAYRNADAAAGIARLQNFAQGQSAIDQMRIQNAANSGYSALGTALGALGSAGMAYAGSMSPQTTTQTAAQTAGLNSLYDGLPAASAVKLPGVSRMKIPGTMPSVRLPTISG